MRLSFKLQRATRFVPQFMLRDYLDANIKRQSFCCGGGGGGGVGAGGIFGADLECGAGGVGVREGVDRGAGGSWDLICWG